MSGPAERSGVGLGAFAFEGGGLGGGSLVDRLASRRVGCRIEAVAGFPDAVRDARFFLHAIADEIETRRNDMDDFAEFLRAEAER